MKLPDLALRNADLGGLVDLLRRQADVKYDVVVPAGRLHYDRGNIRVVGGAVEITDDGATERDAILSPTEVCEDGISEKLGIPRAYLRRMRDEAVADADIADALLLDSNVNAWLRHTPARTFLVRGFRTDDPNEAGIARAFLSDRYAPFDNLDVLMAALDGVRQSGAETGGGAFSIVPRLVVQICKNGMTITKDALRQIHLGGKLDEGVIRWSEETRRKSIELVTAKARDAVATFLDVEYVQRVIARVEQTSGTPVDDAPGTIERVSKIHAFTDDEQRSILDCFIRSGDLTAGGVMQAVTAAAQHVENPDRAAEMEDAALDVLVTAAR